MIPTSDLHIVETRPLVPPEALHREMPITESGARTVQQARERIKAILHAGDQRLLVIVGPCSVHDVEAAKDYANAIAKAHREHRDQLEVVMRVYFEKPRTTVGWKGLINDPHLDGSYDINTGLRRARGLLLHLADMGLPAATELLDPVVPQYIADLISWTAIGARTTESQTHREMASGLSMPIGFKNGTDGSATTAINAMEAAAKPHHFLGISQQGHAAIVSTTGNPDGHLVLRGGKGGPNYAREPVEAAAAQLSRDGLPARLMVDCSHGNSNKDYRRQADAPRRGPAGAGRLGACDGADAGKPPGGGQPEDPGRPEPAHVWPEHHRCLHRSGHHPGASRGAGRLCQGCPGASAGPGLSWELSVVSTRNSRVPDSLFFSNCLR
jgi:3-deoxy-7-phosphoheptulonate synthase